MGPMYWPRMVEGLQSMCDMDPTHNEQAMETPLMLDCCRILRWTSLQRAEVLYCLISTNVIHGFGGMHCGANNGDIVGPRIATRL